MKNDWMRRKLRYRRVTKSFAEEDLPIPIQAKQTLLLTDYSTHVHRLIVREDGSMIGITGIRDFAHILSMSDSDAVARICRVHNGVACDIADLGNGVAALVGTVIGLIMIDLQTVSIERRFMRKVELSAISTTTEKEFMAGDFNGALRFITHERGAKVNIARCVKGIHRDRITWIASDGRHGVVVSLCHTASVWDVRTRRRVAMLPHSYSIWGASMNDHFIATSGREEVRLFRNRPGFRLQHVLRGLDGVGNSFFVQIVGPNLLLSGGMSSYLTATCLKTMRPIARFETTLPKITQIVLTSDARVIVCSNKPVESDDTAYRYYFNVSSDDPEKSDRCAILDMDHVREISDALKAESSQQLCTISNTQQMPYWKLGALAIFIFGFYMRKRRS